MVSASSDRRFPRVTVLLATHNGAPWLEAQLESLYEQTGVCVHVVANDDHSVDETPAILKKWARSHGLVQMPGSGQKLGSANRNFLRLLASAAFGDADYVALSDQDDIWHSDKLIHAVTKLQAAGAVAYSGNVEAFWPHGRTRIIKKSHPQKALDHIFSSPGPGCTFVFTRALFVELHAWVFQHCQSLNDLWVHDWIIYAYIRGAGHAWLIDDYVSMRYRQHETNDIGANYGFKAVRRRFRRVRSGAYQQDLLAAARLAQAPLRLVQALERFAWHDRLWLISRVYQCRRSFKEVLALLLVFIVMRRGST